MKLVILALCLGSLGGSAWAGQTTCIDPQRSYVARPLNHHDIFVQSSLGKPKPPVRLKTTCTNLEPAIGIGLGGQFGCIGLGDSVVASTVDGRRESCKVAQVLPYAPQDGDLPQK